MPISHLNLYIQALFKQYELQQWIYNPSISAACPSNDRAVYGYILDLKKSENICCKKKHNQQSRQTM